MESEAPKDKAANQPKNSKEDKKARKEAKKLAKEMAKKEAEEAKLAKKEAKKAKKEEKEARKESVEISITTKNETVKKKTNKTKQKLYKGVVKLLISPPVDSKNLKELENGLLNTKGLKILLIGGAADGGIQIVISTSKPIPLLNALMETPQVEEAISKDDTIHVSLK